MASITKLPSGRWRAQIRPRQKSVSKTFLLRADADRWATEQQDRLSRGEGIHKRLPDSAGTLGDMIDLHVADIANVGREARRSKKATDGFGRRVPFPGPNSDVTIQTLPS